MNRNYVACMLIVAFIVSPCGINVAQAALDPVPGTSAKTITAVGTLTLPTTFAVTVVGGGSVGFTGNSTSLLAKGSKVVQIDFDCNHAGYQSIVVSTNNRENGTGKKYTGEGTGAGMVNTLDTKYTAPLHWVVFDTQSEATSWTFKAFQAGDKVYDAAGNVVDVATKDIGFANNVLQPYIVDRRQDEVGSSWSGPKPTAWDYYDTTEKSYPVVGYASVVLGPTGDEATLPNVPKNADNNQPPYTTQAAKDKQRQVKSPVYMALGCDYKGQPSGDYATDTLTLDLITIS